MDLKRGEDRFLWFIASILFAKRISSRIAKKTFKLFVDNGSYSPDDFVRIG